MRRAFNIATLLLIFVVIYFSAISARKQSELAQDGAESHAALCVFKADLQHRIDSSEEFLSLTPEERASKYGPQLGSIPPNVIKQSLSNQKQTIESLKILDCP